MNNAVEYLHRAYNEVAPNRKAQESLTAKRHDLESENKPKNVIICMIAQAILDGVLDGNW